MLPSEGFVFRATINACADVQEQPVHRQVRRRFDASCTDP